MSIDVVIVLKEKGLHITSARQNILAAFYKKQGSVTQKDIQQLSGEAFDRVTIYRTLELFVEKGIIHIIPSKDHVMRYALLMNAKNGNCYEHHLHFLCTDCGKTICLDTVPVPVMQLPEGFAGKETDMIIKGTCKTCTKG